MVLRKIKSIYSSFIGKHIHLHLSSIPVIFSPRYIFGCEATSLTFHTFTYTIQRNFFVKDGQTKPSTDAAFIHVYVMSFHTYCRVSSLFQLSISLRTFQSLLPVNERSRNVGLFWLFIHKGNLPVLFCNNFLVPYGFLSQQTLV